jgi:hypothetical protein
MLPALFLPQHFELISSLDLEMVVQRNDWWRESSFNTTKSIPAFCVDTYKSRWAKIASMPRLRKLYVALILAFLPPVTDETCRTILTSIDLLKDKPLEEFYLTVPEHVSRFIRRHKNPPYTSLIFKSDGEYGEDLD